MITLGLAWINSAYGQDYRFLFLGTLVLDLALLELICKAIKG